MAPDASSSTETASPSLIGPRCHFPLITIVGLLLGAWRLAMFFQLDEYPDNRVRFALLFLSWLGLAIGIKLERIGWRSPFAKVAQASVRVTGAFVILFSLMWVSAFATIALFGWAWIAGAVILMLIGCLVWLCA